MKVCPDIKIQSKGQFLPSCVSKKFLVTAAMDDTLCVSTVPNVVGNSVGFVAGSSVSCQES